jgi:hypothetical protein
MNATEEWQDRFRMWDERQTALEEAGRRNRIELAALLPKPLALR